MGNILEYVLIDDELVYVSDGFSERERLVRRFRKSVTETVDDVRGMRRETLKTRENWLKPRVACWRTC